ncbi:hypothetical protein MPSEU_000858100 [Mayamaea pseudoterrestris]|nr:hypothetical protein MPSEU_000858100 [Mayamaea pseudoterrestris]
MVLLKTLSVASTACASLVLLCSLLAPHISCASPATRNAYHLRERQQAWRASEAKHIENHMQTLTQMETHERWRRLQETTVAGTCSFYNSFLSNTICVEFRGDSWSSSTMQTACQQLTGTLVESSSAASSDVSCPIPSNLAGYCLIAQSGLMAASPLPGDCNGNQNLCETTLQGTWEAAGACGGTGGAVNDDDSSVTGSNNATNGNDGSTNVTGAFPDFENSSNSNQDESSGSSLFGGFLFPVDLVAFLLMMAASAFV